MAVRSGRYVAAVLHVRDVNERRRRFTVRRVVLPARATESFTVIGPDLRPVEPVEEYLSWLTDCERSPNTVEAYAYDLRAFWTFLAERELSWDRVGVMELGEFAAWARRPAENVVVLADEAARLSARTVNRMLSGVVGFSSMSFRPSAGARSPATCSCRRVLGAAGTSRFCMGSRAAARAVGRSGCASSRRCRGRSRLTR